MVKKKKDLTCFSSPVGKVVKDINPCSNPVPPTAIKGKLRVFEQQSQFSRVGSSPR